MPLLFAPMAITGSLAVVVIPEFASLNAQNGREKIGSALSLAIKYSCLISGFFFALFAASGVALGKLLYDDEAAGLYICVASVAVLPMGANGLCASALNSLGKENSTFASHAIGLAVLVAVLFSTVWFIGVYAYFLALILSHTSTLAVNLYSAGKLVKPDGKQLSHALFAYVFCAVAALSLSPLCNLISDLAGDAAAVATVFTALIVTYAAYLFLSGAVSKKDLSFLSEKKRAKKDLRT